MDNTTEKYFDTRTVGTSNLARDILPVLDHSGDFTEIRGKDVIASQIRNLLMTPLGLYPFDPEYGTLLYKQLFEPMDNTTEKQIYYEVRERVLKYVDGVDVLSVNLEWDKKHKSCTVDVYYYILDEENKTKLSVEIQNLIENEMYSAFDDYVYNDYRF